MYTRFSGAHLVDENFFQPIEDSQIKWKPPPQAILGGGSNFHP